MVQNFNPEEEEVLELLRDNAEGKTPTTATAFPAIVDGIASLWKLNRRHNRTWEPKFQEEAGKLLRRHGNRHGFTHYFRMYQKYSRRSTGDGFLNACQYRSKIQIIIDDFVPFADLMHPADADKLDVVDALFTENADDIVPIPPGEIPWWVPESHWWWRVPTRHDWTEAEINEKLYGYYEEDWDTP
ncbi:hypothetical protein [Nocardiopsis sp. NPDC006938]|uniref:hypothetical protein n=1 Tax=Nocardiopsis sp. NPDC006938 TaxID=3364337 RepID=UPI0036802200